MSMVKDIAFVLGVITFIIFVLGVVSIIIFKKEQQFDAYKQEQATMQNNCKEACFPYVVEFCAKDKAACADGKDGTMVYFIKEKE